MGKVRVAIIGVGNCASSFVQGVYYLKIQRKMILYPALCMWSSVDII